MTQEWRTLKEPTTFLHTRFSTHKDPGLISQVELWSITRNVFERFGADVESQLATKEPAELAKFTDTFDGWWHTWSGLLALGSQDTDSSGNVQALYFHAAKLYLYSHIHRGSSSVEPIEQPEVADLHRRFRASALSVLREMVDRGTSLMDLPSYFSTMLAFATVALVRSIREETTANHPEAQEIVRLLRRLTENLRAIKIPEASSHPLVGVAKGMDQMAETLQIADHNFEIGADMTIDGDLFTEDIWNFDFTEFGGNWMAFDDH